MIARRGLLKVLGGLIAAPTIVKVADLMPVKPSLAPGHTLTLSHLQHGMRIGDTLRIRLPNDFVVRGVQEKGLFTVTEGHKSHEPYVGQRHLLTIDDFSERVLKPEAERLANNVVLSINEITREAVKIFSQENLFLKYIEDAPVSDPILDQPVTPLQAAALGAAAVLGRNPVVSRRFFGGVREEGSVASPGSSSSDPSRRNTNQETVA